MRKFRTCLLAAGLACASLAPADAKQYDFQAGSWPGVMVYDDQSGAFQNCYVWSDYKNDITVYFQIDYDQTFHVAFTHPNWRLNVGDQFSVGLEVDNRLSDTYRASAYSENGVDVIFTAPGALLDILRYGRVMTIHAQQESFSFRLEGTKVALDRLYDCYAENANRGGGSTNPFSSGANSNPFGGTNSDQTAAGQGGQQADTSQQRAKAISTFEPLLRDRRLASFVVLRGGDIPESLKDYDLVWASEKTYGRLSVYIGDVDPVAEAKRLAAEEGQSCNGQFASATVRSTLGNGAVVPRLATSCVEGNEAWYVYYSIYETMDPKGAYYVIHTSPVDQTAAKDADQAVFDVINSVFEPDYQ